MNKGTNEFMNEQVLEPKKKLHFCKCNSLAKTYVCV